MAQATLSCPFWAIHLENRWGPPSMSAYAQRALIGGLPPGPRFTGDAFLFPWAFRPAGKDKTI